MQQHTHRGIALRTPIFYVGARPPCDVPLVSADFFTVEVLTLRGLVRYAVLFVMKLKTRTVEIAGITGQPNEAWMTQLARPLTDTDDGVLNGVEHLIVDG